MEFNDIVDTKEGKQALIDVTNRSIREMTNEEMKAIFKQHTDADLDDVFTETNVPIIKIIGMVLAMAFREDSQIELTEENLHIVADNICNTLHLPPIKAGKVPPYPKPDDKVTVPIFAAMELAVGGIVSDNGECVELNADQYKLISDIRSMLEWNDAKGDGKHLFPLETIARWANSESGGESVSPKERKKLANMLDFFANTPVYSYTAEGKRVNFHFVHLDSLEDIEINGVKTTVYRIYSVMPISHSHTIFYRQKGLPKGYINNLENATLWTSITDAARSGVNDHVVDFDEICEKLGVSKADRAKKNVLYNKLIDMIQYYGHEEIILKRSFHGTTHEDKYCRGQLIETKKLAKI